MTLEEVLVVFFMLAVLVGLIKGGIQTFQRNWVAALLLLLFLTPIWMVWAFFEIFMAKPVKEPIQVRVENVYTNGNT